MTTLVALLQTEDLLTYPITMEDNGGNRSFEFEYEGKSTASDNLEKLCSAIQAKHGNIFSVNKLVDEFRNNTSLASFNLADLKPKTDGLPYPVIAIVEERKTYEKIVTLEKHKVTLRFVNDKINSIFVIDGKWKEDEFDITLGAGIMISNTDWFFAAIEAIELTKKEA